MLVTQEIPQSLLTYIPFVDAFDWLGLHRFGKCWTGNEIATPETYSLDQAKEWKAELNEKNKLLKERVGKNDRDYTNECIRVDEATGYLEDEHLDQLGNEQDSLYILIYRIDWLYAYFDSCPSIDDGEAYERRF